MKTNKWHLVDAEQRSREDPQTFAAPAPSEENTLQKGNLVKLIFEFDDIDLSNKETEGERMWVKIDEVEGDDYLGTLDNDPTVIGGLKAGDKVHFRSSNIIAIWEDYSA